jgi:hypothetical protein
MAVIASGGNYAFLNHLTAVPMLVSLDDKFLLHILPPSLLPLAPRADSPLAPHAAAAAASAVAAPLHIIKGFWRGVGRWVVVGAVVVLVGVKTVGVDEHGRSPLQNLFGRHPWLETFDHTFLVNAYGFSLSLSLSVCPCVCMYVCICELLVSFESLRV